MNPQDFYQELYRIEEHSGHGVIGLRIEVLCRPKWPDLADERIQNVVRDAVDRVKDAVMERIVAADPGEIERAQAQRKALLGLFPAPIYVEEIPNGYCPRYCCKHLPWFVVTTRVGRITIGWRKHVIQIDWSGAPSTPTAEVLFAAENATKGERYIHAGSLEDARRYIEVLLRETPHENQVAATDA